MKNRIWYKESNPSVIIAVNKNYGIFGSNYFESETHPGFDFDLWYIDPGPPKQVIKKPQSEIDLILSGRKRIKNIESLRKEKYSGIAVDNIDILRMIQRIWDIGIEKGLWSDDDLSEPDPTIMEKLRAAGEELDRLQINKLRRFKI